MLRPTLSVLLLVGIACIPGCRGIDPPREEVDVIVVDSAHVEIEGQVVSIDAMVPTLTALPAIPETEIFIVADTAAPMGIIMDVQNRLQEANYTRLSVRPREMPPPD